MRNTLTILGLAAIVSFSLAFKAKDLDWFNLLGQTFYDKEVNSAFAKYGEKTSHHIRNDNKVQLNWEDHGISTTMNSSGNILSIYFFNDQYSLYDKTFKRFPGQLPLGLNLDHSPEELIEKVGKPSTDKGSAYRVLRYKTNYEYEFLFRQDVMQYMRIGLLDGKVPKENPLKN